ncbi:hypothetical protein HZS_3860 [Henneguya salminicola]|nr:hypothetical protein HZS_3860 [Henneguya salminicola]
MTHSFDVKQLSTSFMENEEDDVSIRDSNKPMGLYGGSLFLFGSIIGTGVFISVNDTFNVFSSNNILIVVLLWTFGGLVSMIGSLCYAELGCRFPKTGGECVYYKESIGRKFSILFVVIYVFLVKTITLAAMALTASKYAVNSFNFIDKENSECLTKIVSLLFLIITFLMNCFNKNFVTKCLFVFSFLKFVALLTIIFLGIYTISSGKVSDWKAPYQFQGFDFIRLSFAAVSVCWSFEGWNSLGLKAGDIRNPSTNIILSSVIGVFFVSLTYVLVVVSYSAVLGFDTVRSTETVALAFAIQTMKSYYPIMSVLIFLSALGSTVSTLYTLGGVTTYAGIEGMLPSFFSLVHTKSRIPFISIFLITIVSCLFVFIKFQILLNYCSFVTWVFYFLSCTSLWVLKLRKNTSKKNTQFSINYVFIIFVQIVCLYIVCMCFYNHFLGCFLIAMVMLFVFCIQYVPFNASRFESFEKMKNHSQNNIKTWLDFEFATKKDVQ